MAGEPKRRLHLRAGPQRANEGKELVLRFSLGHPLSQRECCDSDGVVSIATQSKTTLTACSAKPRLWDEGVDGENGDTEWPSFSSRPTVA